MSSRAKATKQLARQLFKLSVADGAVSSERVAGVLDYVEKHQPSNPVMLLRAYYRLVSTEVARSRAVVEHAGALSEDVLKAIADSLAKKYNRPVTAVAKPNSGLLAGLRVHLGDDVYESSVAGQLATLAAAV